MLINKQILEIFKDAKIGESDGICYLLALHFGYTPTYIPEPLQFQVNQTRIVEKDETGGLKWNLPLFEGAEVAFGWVATEYVPLFKERNPDKGGKVREATARMKKLFATNPEIRKAEVLAATKMYLRNTNPDYIRLPHYFIDKGKGVERTQDILDWVDKYKVSEDIAGRTGQSNTMQ